MVVPREVPDAGPSRRRVLGLLGAAAASAGLAGCSAADREALRGVDPAQVRLDRPDPSVEPPPPTSARELRRRAVRAGSVAAVAALEAAPGAVAVGRTGGTAPVGALLEVHRVHAGVLAGVAAPTAGPSPSASSPGPAGATASAAPAAPATSPPLAGAPTLAPSPAAGPTLAPGARPRAVLAAGAATAVRACLDELADPRPVPELALLHARVAATRTAQATGLGVPPGSSAPPPPPVWPTTPAGAGVVSALQVLLAQEHRTAWSAAVVLAWSTDRSPDAGRLRADADALAEQLEDTVRLLGAEPVRAQATYPTDDAGRPVDGPAAATALALRLAEGTAVAAGGLLVAAVGDGDPAWVRAAVRRLAEAERARWSWGGTPVPWPGA